MNDKTLKKDIVFAETYQCDSETIEYFGLKKFKIIRDKNGTSKNRERYLGTIKRGNVSIRVYVYALPAQFYNFKIKTKNNIYDLDTGSGALYIWKDILELILDDMVVFSQKVLK